MTYYEFIEECEKRNIPKSKLIDINRIVDALCDNNDVDIFEMLNELQGESK